MRNDSLRFAIPLLLSVSFLGGCQSAKDRLEDVLGCFESIQTASRGATLARVGDTTVTTAEFLQHLHSRPPVFQKEFVSLDARRGLLNEIIDEKVIVAAAHRQGLDRDEHYLQQVEAMKIAFLSPIISASMGKVTDQEVLQYYTQHKAEFGSKSEIIVSRIFVKTLADAKKAEQLLKNGRPFADVAKKMSVDRLTASQGGRMLPGMMRSRGPESAKILASLRLGEVSPLRKFPKGYELLRKNEVNSGPASGFEAAKPKIQTILEDQKFSQWMQKAHASMEVTIDTFTLDSLDLSSLKP